MADKYKYNLPVILLLLILSVALHPACNTFDADYGRDNPIDPKNPAFVHSKPDLFTVTVEGEVINVKWKDNTDYNDGYRIEKALNDSTQFELFASLPKDAEEFFDRTRKIGLNTFYRISSILIEDGNEKIVHSEIVSLSIDVIYWFEAHSINWSNEIEVQWGISNTFIDGIRVEEMSLLDSTFTTIIDLDDESNFQENNYFKFSSETETFQTKVRFVAYQYQDDKKVDINYSDKIIHINGVTNIGITFITETETLISWNGNYDFADYYLLELIRDNITVGQWEMPPTGSFTLDVPNSPGWSSYMITGKHKSIESNRHGRAIRFLYNPPSMSVKSRNLDEVHISWTDPSDHNKGTKPSRFTVERSTNNFAFEEIAVLPVDQYSYVDHDLDSGNTYKYRVRTLTSSSIELRVRNMNLYTVTDEEVITLPRYTFNRAFIDVIDEKHSAVYDRGNYTYPVTILQMGDLSIHKNFDSGNKAHSYILSPDGKRAAELVNSNTPGGYDLNIWNIESLSLEKVLQDVYINTISSNPPVIIRYSPTGELIAISENHTETVISLWNPVTGELVNTIEVPEKSLRSFFFNSHANEIIVFVHNEILVFDLNSFELNRQMPNNIPSEYKSQLLVSDSGNFFIYSTDRSLYKIDAITGLILAEISFNYSIEFISANINSKEVLVHTMLRNVLIDAGKFEIIQTEYWQHPHYQVYMVLNKFHEHNAISLERIDVDYQWKMKKWQRRPHWYVTNPH